MTIPTIRPMNRVYLAARFSRFEELNQYRIELEAMGITVTSRWLLGGHEWTGTPEEGIPREVQARFAHEDRTDIMLADTVICFTESSGAGPARGGRHVEMGMAYAWGKQIVVVGGIENVFYALPEMIHADSWEAVKAMIEVSQTRANPVVSV
jgi:nucleoside 2-deoxyribosyltransferase